MAGCRCRVVSISVGFIEILLFLLAIDGDWQQLEVRGPDVVTIGRWRGAVRDRSAPPEAVGCSRSGACTVLRHDPGSGSGPNCAGGWRKLFRTPGHWRACQGRLEPVCP